VLKSVLRMQRSLAAEIMDNPQISEDVWQRFHHELGYVHRALRNHRVIVRALERDPKPVRRVLDIGCGHGELLHEIRRALGVEVIGVDLRAPKRSVHGIPIVAADAVRDRLPDADVAVCLAVIHHLSDQEVVALVRNAGRSVRRLIIVDLVRHRLPLMLFNVFLAPFLSPDFAADGRQSVRRSYTPEELRLVIERALEGSNAHFEHRVTPIRSRQIVDISWR